MSMAGSAKGLIGLNLYILIKLMVLSEDPQLLSVAYFDSGAIRRVNAHLVTHILPRNPGQKKPP